MEFLAAFPDADFDFARYFSMDSSASADQELVHYHHDQDNIEANHHHQSLFCSFVPVETINYSSTTTTTTNSSNCSGNNSPLFDPASHFNQQEISYYDHQTSSNYHIAPPSTNFFDVDQEAAVANYNNTPISIMTNINNGAAFPFEAPSALVVPAMEWQQLKRKLDGLESEVPISPSDQKRPRPTKGTKSRKNQKSCSEDEIMSSTNHGQSSSSCNSEEEIMMNGGSQQEYSNNGDSSKLVDQQAHQNKSSSRASRGSATDPQSLYARKRRERINERLRILQTLVPNGTKVDISTMLEEAVHYVKFLQLQIKLLSSDDLWMYAPICYNGVDVGLNQKLSTLL